MTNQTIIAKRTRAEIFKIINERSDQVMMYVLWIYFAFGFFLATFYNTYFIAVGVGGMCLAAYFITKILLRKSNLYQYVMSAVFAIFSAQFIYQMHGLFEMHFFFFVGSTLLVTFRNWRLFIPLIVITVVHHASFAWLQYSGLKEIYFTQLDYMDLQTFLFHALLAAVIMGICAYWSHDLERTTVSEGEKTIFMEKQVSNMAKNIAFANEISKGNLDAEYASGEDQDELGRSLLTMQQNLRTSQEREKEEKFITVGITKVGDIIRTYGNDLTVLVDEFVKCIVNYTNVNQSGLFLLEEENDEQYLTLAACYAYERKKYLSKKIQIGEGLVGQCFLEREPVYLTEVPNQYLKITSGLGQATPRCLYIQPLQTSDETVGVLEIASFTELKEFERQFIQRAAENIASAIISSRTTQRIKLLLEDSQQRTEEMKAQEEEMRQNMEELQATQEEMERKQVENENRINAINQSGIASIEFAMNGTILDANKAFLSLMDYSLEEVQGKHHKIFVEDQYAMSEEYQKFWEDLRNGIPRPGEYRRISKSGNAVFIQGSYSIISDQNGTPVKVLKLATDITGLKLKQTAVVENGILSKNS